MPAQLPPLRTSSVVRAALLWLLAAILIGASGVLQSLVPPAPQLVLLVITALCLAASFRMQRLHAWAMSVDLRCLVALHLSRFVGFYFLALYARGELPYRFAVVGGWGDIVVAALALGLLAAGPPSKGPLRRGYIAWNLLGLIDILFVVATAARSTLADPASMRALQTLPLNLLLTFLVPIIITTHVVMGYRLLKQPAAGRT